MKNYLRIVAIMIAALSITTNSLAESLSLDQAILQAVENDEWLVSSKLKESAFRDEAMGNQSLPDPVMSIGIANLPTDSWDFDQENMTQLKVGVTQRFPGGDTRKVKARKSHLMADINPYQRQERKAQLTRTVSHLWLDSYFAMKSIQLIESDRYLFEQLIEVATARYESALGKARQQDIIRAQLELTKLEDRLTRLQLQYDTNRQLLAEWLPLSHSKQPLADVLPEAGMFLAMPLVEIKKSISRHPQLRITDKQVAIQQADIDLARQQYKPGWALNASYGYRDDSPMGMDRSDFFSLGVSFDLPVFTSNRQDKNVSAANYRKQALTIDYQLLHKKLLSEALRTQSELERLTERSDLYQNRLLKQAREQAEASLSAYTNDDGDFAEVMRAYITELNSKIESLEITIKQQKSLATMNYLLAGVSRQAQENNYEYR
jgi:outer membrane protein TolC